jgi:hypothetical protein
MPGLEWFPKEELSFTQLNNAINLCEKENPNLIITHEAPRSIVKHFGNPGIVRYFGFDPETFTTRTSEALSLCFERSTPTSWYFGHYHKSWTDTIKGCRFQCLEEMEYVDVRVQ